MAIEHVSPPNHDGLRRTPYQVFFVEDEIVTREGIRDNVDWQAQGFELCGEAPDGEIALPLLQAARPDVLITDIKMPFMDGLQLCKIVRERMPRTKVVILSGHDEFDYAQQAVKLGVTEYLLKPVTVLQLHQVLQRLALQLDRERKEQDAVQGLRQQVQESRAALIERLWFKLLVGAISLARRDRAKRAPVDRPDCALLSGSRDPHRTAHLRSEIRLQRISACTGRRVRRRRQ